MSFDEKEIIRLLKSNFDEAFSRVIEEYQKKVFSMTSYMLGNYDDALDASQEVFFKVYKSIKNFREESSLTTWIYRITSNVCMDEMRKRKKTKNVVSISRDDEESEVQIIDDKNAPEKALELSELQRIVRHNINLLEKDHRAVIILRDIEGLSYEEIADILNCSIGTVKSRINRARGALKKKLEKNKELLLMEYV